MFYLFYLFAFLFPYMIYPWGHDPYFTFPKANYLIYSTLLLWIAYLYDRNKNQKPLFSHIKPAEWLLLLFMLLIGVSTLQSVNIYLSLYGEILRKEGISALFCYASLFFFSFRMIHTNSQRSLLLATLAFSSAIVAVYGILQHFKLDFLPRSIKNMDTTRSFAFFDNPNFFGSYLVLMLLLTLTLYIMPQRNKIGFLLYGLASAILFIALIYSETRSAWIGVFWGTLFLTFTAVWGRKHLWKRWLALLVIFILLFYSINMIENGSYFNRAGGIIKSAEQILTDEDSGHAGSSRWYIWKKSLPLVPEYFWFGSGPDTFAKVFPHDPYELYEYFNNPIIKIDKAHNEYLQMAVTLGVPALIIYLCFIGLILFSAVRSNNVLGESEKILNIGLVAIISGYMVQAFFNISVITVAPYFWIFLGLSYQLSNSSRGKV